VPGWIAPSPADIVAEVRTRTSTEPQTMTRTIGNGFAVLAAAGMLWFSTAAASRGADDCPTLPDDSGFEWHYQPGPDFYLCYANPTNGGKSSFGMYFGFAPNLFPSGAGPSHSGRIGDVAVTWSSMKSESGEPDLAFQTLFPTSASVLPQNAKVHVWTLAKSADELEKIEALLEEMKVESAF
jgi:hypothetical protein